MKHIRTSIEINAAADEVWRLITEFDQWPAWGPTVADVESEAAVVAPGVTGRVKTIVGLWLPFAIAGFEPSRSWTWKVAGIPATGHSIAVVSDTRTFVEFTVPIAAAPYVLVLRQGLRRLKRMAETTR